MWLSGGGSSSNSKNSGSGIGDGPGEKRRLISHLLSLRGVSCQAVAQIMGKLDNTEPQRWEIRDTLSTQLAAVCTRLPLPLIGGGTFSWHVALPQRLLPFLLKQPGGLSTAYLSAFQAHPCDHARPWRFALYADEITPGNPLRPDNKRKILAFYAGWVEMGDILRLEESWMTIGVIRSSQCKDIPGGLSRVVAVLLRALFTGPESLNHAGIAVGQHMLFSSFGRLLCDEAAGKSIWGVRGAASHRPCLQCKNVVALSEDSLASHDATGYLVDIACIDPARFDPAEDGDIASAFDAISAMRATPGVTKAAMEKAERAYGISFDEHNLVADAELRQIVPLSAYTRDPMHIMLAGGVLNTEMFLVLRALARSKPGFSYATLRTWLSADWMQAKSRAKSNLPEIFSTTREAASNRDHIFKAGAAEMLNVYPLVRHFLEVVVPSDMIPLQRASFLACCRVVDLMQAVKRDGPGTRMPALRIAIADSFRKHVAAYSSEFLRPKNHYQWHMCDQAEADGMWLDCFVHERKHQVVKDCATPTRNTRSYEKSVMASIVNATVHQLQRLRKEGFLSAETEHIELSVALGCPCFVAHRMRYNFVQFDTGDFIFVDEIPGIVEACARCGLEWALVFRRFEVIDRRFV